MSGKYAIWLNYDNDKKKYQIPVNPEEIKIKVDGKATTSEIDKLGTLLHKGRRGPLTVSWESYFPAKYGANYCACTAKNYKNPSQMHKWVLSLMQAANPVHLVLSGGPFGLNIYAVITSYSPEEKGGDPGTVWYEIELKEYRSVKVSKYTKKTSSKTKKTTTKKRVTNTVKPKTYTIKSGDCLWNIAKKYYGNGAQYTKILNANRSVLDKAAKQHGYSNCNNGNRIWPGTKITIP